MTNDSLEHVLTVARAVAEEAGKVVLEGWRAGGEVRKKGTIDLVTDHDLASEEVIRGRLSDAFPHHHIVAEEQQATHSSEAEQAGPVWYVDPLDGTTNFAHGHPFFSVSLGLFDGAEGLVGVVAAPALGLTWSAARGHGAWRNRARCHVSATPSLGDALCATGFPYDKWTNPDHNVAELDAFLTRTHGVRRGGSAAIDLAMVADGTFDLYWEKGLSPWDMAAGAVLVSEAAGTLSDYDGSPGDPRTGRLVATNGHLHQATLDVLARARRAPPHSDS
jgi:myo-inositol-1(or 4)-monophosphatase